MILGLGIDIIEIERVKDSIDKFGDKFLNKLFTEKEIEYCSSKPNKYQHYAARFAAKEAVAKALATGWNHEFNFKFVEIFNEPNGMPKVNLHGSLKSFLENDKELKISITHSRDYAACVAIIQRKT